jgi:DNA-binding CsgD family transcriptional regulator
MLEPFGLAHTANLIYREALEHPGQTPENLSVTLTIPLTDIEEGIAELSSLGLAVTTLHGAVVTIPMSDAALIVIARQKSEHFAQHVHATQSIIEGERIVGAEHINGAIRRLRDEARDEIATFVPGGAQKPVNLEVARTHNTEMFDRGIRSRTIYLSSVQNDPTTRDHIKWLSQHGARVRTAPTLPIRMMIADAKVAIIPTYPANATLGITVHRDPGTVTALHALFEKEWKTATPWGTVFSPHTVDISAREKVIFELLATGRKDDAIARELAVSPHTVRKSITAVEKRLDAATRLEALYKIIKHGWL